jgi:hypothetical protein
VQHIGLIVGLFNDVFQKHSLLRGDQEKDGQTRAMKVEKARMT